MKKTLLTTAVWLLLSVGLHAGSAFEQLQSRTLPGDAIRTPAGTVAPDRELPPERVGSRPQAPEFSGDIGRVISVWREKCGKAAVYSNPGCRIHECDLIPSGCRPGRLLLFRGEPEFHEQPAVSGLYRSALSGSGFNFYAKDPLSSAERLRSEISLIRPMKAVPAKELGESENEIVLVRNGVGSGWYWRYDKDGEEDPYLKRAFPGKYAKTEAEAFSLMETLFYLHKNGPFPKYKDPGLGLISIDPFVSFSLNTEVAVNFPIYDLLMQSAINGGAPVTATPYLIVVSVPESEIVTQCGEALQKPGTILDPSKSCRGFNDYNEHELSAFLFTKPEYVLGALPMSKEFMDAWQKHDRLP